jgi:hypothetical protein
VLTFGPSLDSFICHDEIRAPAAAAGAIVTVQPASTDSAGHLQDGLDACIHGHCHHGAAYVPVQLPTADGPAVRPSRQSWARVQVATSNPQFELMRPPRA